MAISILTNTAATGAVNDLSKGTQTKQESLVKLSSGSRIVKTSDDAGGLAVSMKLASAVTRSKAAHANVLNAISFLQTQGAALQNVASVLNRMTEIVTSMKDPFQTGTQLENYVAEMAQLAKEVGSLGEQKFNDIDLFTYRGSPGTLVVQLDQGGSQTCEISRSDFGLLLENIVTFSDTFNGIDPLGNSGGLTAVAYQTAIELTSTLIANNGAQLSRLSYALDTISSTHNSLEAANSKVADLDIAAETTRLARSSIHIETGTKVLAQANSTAQVALKLMQGSV
jgi:flagellin